MSQEIAAGYLLLRRVPRPEYASATLLPEQLNVEVGLIACSWLCNGLASHCATSLGVRPGGSGLLDSLEAAERCRVEISQGSVGAEPGPWFSWLLVEYP